MTDYEHLTIERRGDVATLTLASSARFNSLSIEMARELVHAITELGEDESVRCLALTGSDGAFCAGADLASLAGDASDAPRIRRLASTLHDAVLALHQAPVPVVVGLNGVAAGAGFGLALAGDVVVMSDDARMEFAYGRIGLTGDGATTFLLPRMVGLRRAKEIALLDEPINSDYAVSLGLVTESVPAAEFEGRFRELAERLADGPTRAFGATKQLMTESFDRSLAGQMAEETDVIAGATHSEDYERGYAAFFEKGTPDFVGR